eukprot:NODE_6733_length_610_cov_6.930481_g5751_i0.p4 GENE.NODE_6733_length_610_cov_6.930481_g5751_i0~~NODE_6733_length_610_cov_6.930481_g5751_i0.p4  ORF type:complete len:69 (-),score=0.18 NODE_6733_length_610_cov_6.930481_g5751_i0:74-280(-)
MEFNGAQWSSMELNGAQWSSMEFIAFNGADDLSASNNKIIPSLTECIEIRHRTQRTQVCPSQSLHSGL